MEPVDNNLAAAHIDRHFVAVAIDYNRVADTRAGYHNNHALCLCRGCIRRFPCHYPSSLGGYHGYRQGPGSMLWDL